MNQEVSSDLYGMGIFEIAFRIVSCAYACSSRSVGLALIRSNAFLVCSSPSSIKVCAYSNKDLVFLPRTLSCLDSTST